MRGADPRLLDPLQAHTSAHSQGADQIWRVCDIAGHVVQTVQPLTSNRSGGRLETRRRLAVGLVPPSVPENRTRELTRRGRGTCAQERNAFSCLAILLAVKTVRSVTVDQFLSDTCMFTKVRPPTPHPPTSNSRGGGARLQQARAHRPPRELTCECGDARSRSS